MNSIKINKITLLLLILFGLSLGGCISAWKKVGDAVIPDIILPDSVLYPEKKKEETKPATKTPRPPQEGALP